MSDRPPGRTDETEEAWERTWPPLSYWVKVGIAVVLVVIAVRILAALQGVLHVIGASLVLAVGLQPAIAWFERRGLRRGLGLGLVLTLVMAVLGGMVALVAPLIVSQAANLLEELPSYVEQMRRESPALARLADMLDVDALLAGDGTDPETAMDVAGSVLSFVFNAVTLVVVTPYFAMSLPSMKRFVVRLLAPSRREDFLHVLNESTDLIANYIVGNAVISLVMGVATWAGLQLLGIPFALALAAWVALTDLIPIFGAVLGALGVAAVAAFVGPVELAWALGLILVLQQIENFVVAPRVMQRAVDLNPAVVILALMVGGALAGLVGALLALPVAALVKIIVLEYVVRERVEQIRDQVAEAQVPGRFEPRRHAGSRRLP